MSADVCVVSSVGGHVGCQQGGELEAFLASSFGADVLVVASVSGHVGRQQGGKSKCSRTRLGLRLAPASFEACSRTRRFASLLPDIAFAAAIV